MEEKINSRTKEKLWSLIFIILLIGVPIYILIPLFEYETWPGGHDSTTTVFCSWNIIEILTENFHFPIAWQAEDHEFNGNAFWLFYQPLSYFVVFLMSLISSFLGKTSPFLAMKLAVFMSFIISEIGIFLLIRTILKDSEYKNKAATFGALVYLLAPYRIIDLYSRNAYSELWVFPWMPFYLLGFYKLFFEKEIKGAYILAISTACLFLSHLIPSFYFILILHLAFVLFLLLKRRVFSFLTKSKKIIGAWFLAQVAGLTLCSFYIFPVLSNLKYSIGDTFGFDRSNLKHIVEHINWTFFMLEPDNFDREWQVGQLFLAGLVIVNLFIFFGKKSLHKDLMIFLNLSVLITFIFLMSETIWEYLPEKLYAIQFPWRLFLIYSFIGSVILALLANEFRLHIIILVVLLGFHFYTGKRFLNYGREDMISKYYDTESWNNEFSRKHYTTANGAISYGFLPKTSQPTLFNFHYQNYIGKHEKSSNTFLLNVKPGVNIISHSRKGSSFDYELSLANSTFLIFTQYFYPTWELYIDSKKSDNIYLTENGYIGFEVPKGKHHVKIVSR